MSKPIISWATLGVLTVLASLLLAFPLAAASSPPPPPSIPPGSTSASWAYGKQFFWNDSSVTNLAGNNSSLTSGYSESGQIALGLEVIYIQTNTSQGQQVEVYEALTLVGSVNANAQGSSSSGATGSGSASLNVNAWYVVTDFLNFTNGQVTLSTGAPASALALQNAQTNVQADVEASFSASESYSYGGSSSSFSANGSFGANVAGSAQASFTPALGIVPLNVSPGQSWNSAANYTGSGSVAANSHYYLSYPMAYGGAYGNGTGSAQCPAGSTQQGQNCVVSNSSSGSFSVTSTGSVTLFGQDLGTVTLPAPTSGQTLTAQEVDLQMAGGFGFTDGFVLVPSSLISATAGAGTLATGMQSLSHVAIGSGGNTVDYQANNPSHIGVVGASGGSMGGQTLQSQPQDASVATQAAQTNLAAAQGTSSPAAKTFPLVLVLVIAVVAVVVITSAVIWTGRKRRRVPPSELRGTAGSQPAAPYLQPQAPAQPGYAPAQPPRPPTPNFPPPPPQAQQASGQRDPVGFYW